MPPIVAAIENAELIDFRAFVQATTGSLDTGATATVPEPAATLLLACGVLGLAFLRRARG